MDECELITLVTVIACTISKCSSDDDISILAAVFSQLGDTLATILTQREINEQRNNDNTENNTGGRGKKANYIIGQQLLNDPYHNSVSYSINTSLNDTYNNPQ